MDLLSAQNKQKRILFILPIILLLCLGVWNIQGTDSQIFDLRGLDFSHGLVRIARTVKGDKINITISRNDLKKLADSGESLTLQCDTVKMTFAPDALYAILETISEQGTI